MSAVMRLRYPLGVLLASFLTFAGPSGGAGLLRPAPELRVPSGYAAQRYATGNLRQVYFYPNQLVGHTERTYHPGQ